MERFDPIAAVRLANPYPAYAHVVSVMPFYRDAERSLWVAASAERVTEVLSSDALSVRPTAEPVPRAIAGTPPGDLFARLVRMRDDEGHGPLRAAIVASLEGVDAIASMSERCATELLDEHPPVDGAAIDAYARALPALAIAMGLTGDAHEARSFAVEAEPLVRTFALNVSPEGVAMGTKSVAKLRAGLERTREPGSSRTLLSTLQVEGEKRDVDRSAIDANAIGFMIQTYDGTAATISATLELLSRNEAITGAVRRDPSLLRAVVSETIRYDAPVQNTRRYVVTPTTIAGHRLEPGEGILVLLGAANRDPAVNARPNDFDIERKHARAFTFGVGKHACPGAALAIAIATAAIAPLLATGFDPASLGVTGYRPLPNVRMATFGS